LNCVVIVCCGLDSIKSLYRITGTSSWLPYILARDFTIIYIFGIVFAVGNWEDRSAKQKA